METLPAPPPPQPQDCLDEGTTPAAGVPAAGEEETGCSAVFSTKNFINNEISGFLDRQIKRPATDGPSIRKAPNLPDRKRTPSKEFFDRTADSSSFSKMVPPKKQEVEDNSQIGDEATREETDQAGCLFIQNWSI